MCVSRRHKMLVTCQVVFIIFFVPCRMLASEGVPLVLTVVPKSLEATSGDTYSIICTVSNRSDTVVWFSGFGAYSSYKWDYVRDPVADDYHDPVARRYAGWVMTGVPDYNLALMHFVELKPGDALSITNTYQVPEVRESQVRCFQVRFAPRHSGAEYGLATWVGRIESPPLKVMIHPKKRQGEKGGGNPQKREGQSGGVTSPVPVEKLLP